MKMFSIKNVAFIFLAITIFCGTFFSVAEAATVVAAPKYTSPSGDNFVYKGVGFWVDNPAKTIFGTVQQYSNSLMESYYKMPSNYLVSEREAYDNQLQLTGHVDTYSPSLKTETNDEWSLKGLFLKVGDFWAGTQMKQVTQTIEGILILITAVLGALTTVLGLVLDKLVVITMSGTTDIFKSLGDLYNIWLIIRDFLNITFIFLCLYIAIRQILGKAGSNVYKMFGEIVVAAVLINFSWFICRLMIDASGYLSVALYNQAGLEISSFSEKVIDGLRLKNLLMASLTDWTITSQIATISTYVFKVVAMWWLCKAFYTAIAVLIARIVSLIFLIITSPVAFVGSTIPFIGSYGSKWWKEFMNQLTIAPAFALLLVIVTGVINLQLSLGVIKNVEVPNSSGTLSLDVTNYIVFFLIITFFSMGIKAIKDMSGTVGDKVMGYMNAVTKAGATVAAVTATVATAGAAGAAIGAGTAAAGGRMAAAQLGAKKGVGVLKDVFFGKKYEDIPGAVGFGAKYAKEQMYAGIKTGTSGVVDIQKAQDWLKKSEAESLARNRKAVEKDAKQMADQEKLMKDLKAQEETIKSTAKTSAQKEFNDTKDPDREMERDFTEKEAKQNFKQRSSAQEKLIAAKSSGIQADIDVATKNLASVQDNYTKSMERLEKFKQEDQARMEALIKQNEDKYAAMTNTTMDKLKTGQEDAMMLKAQAENKIEGYIKKINDSNYVEALWNYGSLTPSAKTDLIKKLRDFIDKGGKASEAEEMRKMLEKFAKEKK